MAVRSSAGRPVLLSAQGQRLLEAAYERRARLKCSFPDFADGYIQRLKDDGALAHYVLPGLDPFEVLESIAEQGVGR